MIGIVSHDEDLHAATVRSHLDSLGVGCVQLDTARMPDRIALTTWTRPGGDWRAEWGIDGVDARDLRVMWWRRPQPYMPSADVTSQQDRMFVIGELRETRIITETQVAPARPGAAGAGDLPGSDPGRIRHQGHGGR
jgi:hypothetical protein